MARSEPLPTPRRLPVLRRPPAPVSSPTPKQESPTKAHPRRQWPPLPLAGPQRTRRALAAAQAPSHSANLPLAAVLRRSWRCETPGPPPWHSSDLGLQPPHRSAVSKPPRRPRLVVSSLARRESAAKREQRYCETL